MKSRCHRSVVSKESTSVCLLCLSSCQIMSLFFFILLLKAKNNLPHLFFFFLKTSLMWITDKPIEFIGIFVHRSKVIRTGLNQKRIRQYGQESLSATVSSKETYKAKRTAFSENDDWLFSEMLKQDFLYSAVLLRKVVLLRKPI